MYENSSQPPLSFGAFIIRLLVHFGIVVLLVIGSLAIGIAGYCYFEGLSLADAFLYSASLLGGFGLVETPQKTEAKLFAGVYALYSGLVFVAIIGVILAPILHRIVHVFHHGDGRQDD